MDQLDNLSGENEKLASENKLLRQQLKDSEQEIAKRDEIASRNTKTIPYFDVLKDDLTEAQFYIEKPYNENEISPGVLFSNQINISSWTDYFQPSVEQFGEIIPRLNQILKEYREVTELVTPLVGISKLKPYTTTQWTDQYIGFTNIMTSLKLYEANWRYIQVRSQFLIGIYQYEYGEIDQNQLDLLRDAYLQLKDKLSEELKGTTFAD